jgi:CheY-like chemotaxis protein
MITVLYVDTDPKLWMIISHIFEQYRTVSVFPAGSGEEGLAWLSQYHADVIISDIKVPSKN